MSSKINEIYENQEEFQNLLITKTNYSDKKLRDFNDKEKTLYSKELALLMHQEVSEFIDAVGNYKLHKTQKDGKSIKEIRKEIADIFIFSLNMALTHNMTLDELLSGVESKQNENFQRQKSGY